MDSPPSKPCYKELLTTVESLKMQVNRLQEQLKCIQNMVTQTASEDSTCTTNIVDTTDTGKTE